ncbi:MAG: hypothetical protein WC827_01900 [Candidatus Paceibacterota bacterium]
MKNTLVTSLNGQVQAIIDMVGIAAMNTVRIRSEELTTAARQRVLAQGDKFTIELSAFITAKMAELAEQVIGYLKLISGDETIIIGETDGTDTIALARDVFTGWVDPDFVNYGTDVKGQPTKETKVQVLEMIKDGNLAQIFGGFGENLDRLCLSQSQIIRFVKDHSKWLLTGSNHGTFFLFKVQGEFFIADVLLGESIIGVDARHLLDGVVWDADRRRRVVVPQL